MTLTRLINRPCTLLLRDNSDDVDDFSEEEAEPTEVETVCEIQQRNRQERGDQAELSDTTWNVFLPLGTEIDSGDAIRVDDLGEFELIGAPESKRNPLTQLESHVEATARRTAGPEVGS